MNDLSDRDLQMLAYCLFYAEHPCGLPGHALMILVAKLYNALKERHGCTDRSGQNHPALGAETE